ncbi:MAG: zf-HC2 domain-containing protein [Acidobacteriota bacterium]
MTKCEELQFDLPMYFDGSLNADERSTIDMHLPECPLCRQKLSEFEELSLGLRSIPRQSAPGDLINAIRALVGAQLALSTGAPSFRLIERRHRWVDTWLMPSATGAIATLVIGFTLLSLTLSSSPVPLSAREISRTPLRTPVFLASNPDISPDEYVRGRFAVSGESPSINPRGALVALTRSLVRGEMRDDEVVVVADVFSNGLAQIAEVVEPSRDRKAVEELQKALGSDPSLAPFVPANLDQRSPETIRVILKIQNVNVSTSSLGPTLKSRRSHR